MLGLKGRSGRELTLAVVKVTCGRQQLNLVDLPGWCKPQPALAQAWLLSTPPRVQLIRACSNPACWLLLSNITQALPLYHSKFHMISCRYKPGWPASKWIRSL